MDTFKSSLASSKCDICLDSNQEDEDLLIQCNQCLLWVHQHCYGSDLVQSDVTQEHLCNWKCTECAWNETHGEFSQSTPCFMCKQFGGAMKKYSAESWAHVSCINWNQHIFFKDKFKDSTNISPEMLHLYHKPGSLCYICELSEGIMIQCDKRACKLNFHVRCGIQKGLIKDWETMDMLRKDDDDFECSVFCQDHLEIFEEKKFEFSPATLVSRIQARKFRKTIRDGRLKKLCKHEEAKRKSHKDVVREWKENKVKKSYYIRS
ncbi:unnamed protein product [Moneuplotes crassus]|uniref:PHD-type domain-containing protein n=1 Tax=Euplotes crassus TaxID=5936 RepID=A0AAD2DB02_EUPCR|nr:unnamed protein product [Moneuplotes crassus]